jgi:hypothetical protein
MFYISPAASFFLQFLRQTSSYTLREIGGSSPDTDPDNSPALNNGLTFVLPDKHAEGNSFRCLDLMLPSYSRTRNKN